MDLMDFSVSVVIPAYNAEAYITRAVDSVLKQTRPAKEIIVVDDGSTDQTGAVLETYGSTVTRIHQENTGGSEARNRGIEAATGEWIAFLDADDEWLPESLERQAAIHKACPGLKWSYANMIVRRMDGMLEYPSHDEVKARRLLSPNGPFFSDCLEAYAAGMPTNMITLVIRREVLREVGMFEPRRPWAQDTDLAFRIAYRYPVVGYCPQPLAINYFARPGSISTVNRNAIHLQKAFIQTHLKQSAQAGRYDAFVPVAGKLLIRWINEARNTGRSHLAARAFREFAPLLPSDLAREIRVRSRVPQVMNRIIDSYFHFKRVRRRTKIWMPNTRN